MSEHIEHDAADQIRRLLAEDERFPGVSGATAFREADPKQGWTDAGFFSFERDGRLYFVTVDLADTAAPAAAEGETDERCAGRDEDRYHGADVAERG
jgi:hypothetical protein